MRSRLESTGDAGSGSDTPQQFTFQLVNTAADTTTANVIFITTDASYNQLSLSIGLNTGSVQLAPGTIPDPTTPPSEGTTLYVDLSELQLSDAVWDALDFPSDDWQFQKFPTQNVVGLTPSRTLSVSSGTSGALSINITGLLVPAPLASQQVQLYVSYYGVPNISGVYATFGIALQIPPDKKSQDLATAIKVSLDQNAIVTSVLPDPRALNAFSLLFESTQHVQVKAGDNTQFVVKFVYGPPDDPYGYGALTDVTNANKISVTPGNNAEQWNIKDNKGTQSPSWTLSPPSGSPIVGTDAQSIVEFQFANLLTTYQPGPTAMLITYSGVPGYADGTFALSLNKVAHALITSFTVTPNPTYFSNGAATVTVRWTASGARSLELTQGAQTTSVTGLTSTPATLAATETLFTLKATGAPGTVDNTAFASVDAYALPVINSFAGGPTEIYAGSSSHDVTVAWAVDSTDSVSITSTGGAFSGQTYPLTGSATATLQQPQMISLAPTTAKDPLSLTRRLVINAFTPKPQPYALGFAATAIAASPTGPFVVAAGDGTKLTVIDTIRYAAASSVALGHAALALAFSPDGTTLVTANSDSTVSILGITIGPDGMPVFGAATTLTLAAPVTAIVYATNGPRVFAAIDPGSTKSGFVVSLLRGAGGTWVQEGSVGVGRGPAGLALQEPRLWVANSREDTVSRVGLTTSGALGNATTYQGFTGGPCGIALTPGGQQLLVACATANAVRVVDPNHPSTGQARVLTVNGPQRIAMAPGGAYAFVTNPTDGALALIDCWGLPDNARVLGTGISVGANPIAVTVTPDGLGVLVATPTGITVVTLATHHALGNLPSVPNAPTNVAVTPDGLSVFAWHDASIPAQIPSPGVLVYASASGVVSNLLASSNVLRVVASPDPLAKQAYAIVQGDPSLYVVDTEQFDVTQLSLAKLGAPTGAVPVALAISGEGDTLYVAVADASHALSLVVLSRGDTGWTRTQTVSLYTTKANARVLLRATPDGSTVFLVDLGSVVVRAIQRAGAKYALARTTIQGHSTTKDIAILPDGSTAYVLNAGAPGTVTVIDVPTLRSYTLAIPQPFVNLTGIQAAPDGRRLFATDTNAGAVRILDPHSLRILQTIPLATDLSTVGGAQGLAVAFDGSRVYTANTVGQTIGIVEQIQMGTQLLLAPRTSQFLVASPQVGDAYNGLFMRHNLGDTPQSPGDGWSMSPDVIPYGESIEPDLTKFTTTAGYATDYVKDVTVGSPNYVYIRGLNTTTAPLTARAYFYYVGSSLTLWPTNWSCDNVKWNGDPKINWVDIPAPAPGKGSPGVGVCPTPLQWTPPPLPAGSDHYCVIAWVDSSANPQPPPLASWNFTSGDQLVAWILAHHNVGWRNTHEVYTPPPDYLYNSQLQFMEGGGTVFLNIQFIGLDGQFEVNLQGDSQDNSIATGRLNVADNQGGWSPPQNPLSFPGAFLTSLQINHWPQTPGSAKGRIKVTLGMQTAPQLQAEIERMYRPMGLRTPLRRSNTGFPMVIMGSLLYDLKYGPAAKAEQTERKAR